VLRFVILRCKGVVLKEGGVGARIQRLVVFDLEIHFLNFCMLVGARVIPCFCSATRLGPLLWNSWSKVVNNLLPQALNLRIVTSCIMKLMPNNLEINKVTHIKSFPKMMS
jgi:hypothetical protein